jgi:hypothetical protein
MDAGSEATVRAFASGVGLRTKDVIAGLARPIRIVIVEHHEARAEFRRSDRSHSWVLAGVWIDHVSFHPATAGVEPIRRRLPESGLLGWTDLPVVIAPTVGAAGEAALEVARRGWPTRVRPDVPFANSG